MGDRAVPAVVEAVRAGTEGNPLFLEERLLSMVDTGALVGGPGRWHLSEKASVGVPEALERMVRSRADYLTAGPPGRPAGRLGHRHRDRSRPFGGDLRLGRAFRRAFGRGGGRRLAAQAGQRPRADLPVPPRPHTGSHLPGHAPGRAQAQARAGRLALEAMSEGRLPEVGAVLARHFAAAGEHEQAVHFFEMAGDHALRAFANDEAIILFRSALEVAKQEGSHVPALAAPLRSD